ncbi:MAG: 3-deoxy-7-phosphoheptulonate synthase, partial [Acidobacteriota bacterium]|nr:3-deoxy-7-phosphoheptulonate synthase [Acidobacteriota bacterium]
MILILNPNTDTESETYRQLLGHLSRLPNIELRVHREQGVEKSLTEVHLIGSTAALSVEDMRGLPGVKQVVRVSEEYRVIGRHRDDERPTHFDYQGVRFGQDTLNVFAGLCAV